MWFAYSCSSASSMCVDVDAQAGPSNHFHFGLNNWFLTRRRSIRVAWPQEAFDAMQRFVAGKKDTKGGEGDSGSGKGTPRAKL